MGANVFSLKKSYHIYNITPLINSKIPILSPFELSSYADIWLWRWLYERSSQWKREKSPECWEMA